MRILPPAGSQDPEHPGAAQHGLLPNCTWTRTVRNTRNVATSWTASGTAITPGFNIEVSPSSFAFGGGLGETQELTITATPTTDLTGAVAFGEVALHETGGVSPDELMTVAIKGLPGGGGTHAGERGLEQEAGQRGDLDIDLPLDGTGALNADRKLLAPRPNRVHVLGHGNSVDSTSTSCGRVISTTANGSTVTVLLKDIQTSCDGSDVTVTLTGVNGDSGHTGLRSRHLWTLAGDINGDGRVDGTDLQSVRRNSGAGLVTDANFRNDVSGDGKVNHADISLTRAARGIAAVRA